MIRTFLLVQPTRSSLREHAYWAPSTDVYYCRDNLEIRVEAAGMRFEDFMVKPEKTDSISISGIRTDRILKNHFIQMEIPFGEFHISIELPADFSPDYSRISTIYENGFFTVRCPRKRPKQILIQNGE